MFVFFFWLEGFEMPISFSGTSSTLLSCFNFEKTGQGEERKSKVNKPVAITWRQKEDLYEVSFVYNEQAKYKNDELF